MSAKRIVPAEEVRIHADEVRVRADEARSRAPRRTVRPAKLSTPAPRYAAAAHDEILIEELNAVHGELGRVDNKSSMLLGFAAGGLLLATTVPPVGLGGWLFTAGMGLAAASIVPLLSVVRPRLGSGGFAHHARRTAAQIQAELSKVDPRTWRSEQLIALSRIAVRKFKLLRIAAAMQTLALLAASVGAVLVMV
jgi:hypothetical protein